VDLIAAPVAPTTAFRIGEHLNDPLAMYLEAVKGKIKELPKVTAEAPASAD